VAGRHVDLDFVYEHDSWQFAVGSSVNSGPSVVDGTVYWGTGYARGPGGTSNNKLYAFSLDGK